MSQVVLSGERHYFGFGIRPLLYVLQAHMPCRTRLRRRCDKHAVYQLDYAFVRQRDVKPTYVTDMACEEHAQEFADEWGLVLPEADQPPTDECPLSKRMDGKKHSWRFDGDDPYVICVYCDERRDAASGRVLMSGRTNA